MVGAHNCQMSKYGTMVGPRGGGLGGWGLEVEGHIIFEMLKVKIWHYRGGSLEKNLI